VPTFQIGSGVGDNYATLLLSMPDVGWFKSAVMASLYELTNDNNWREEGDVALSFAIEEASQMVAGYTFLNFNPFPIGLVLPYGGTVAPPGYLLCDGTNYLPEEYPELYAVIGGTFGEDFSGFYLPDLRGNVVVGMQTDPDIGAIFGVNSVTITEDQMPSHSHTIPLTATTLAVEPGEVTVMTPLFGFTQDTGATGGGNPHENRQPSLVLNYIMYAGRI